jgi:hypothetical protein
VSTSHFDILVLGSSPAARMAAALCAKGGRKVLLLESEPPSPAAPWCHASLHLERLLETLGGRACLRPTPALQVHAGTTRLTLHGRQTLAAELLRECRPDQAQALRLLEELQLQGLQLEELLWRAQGLPLLGWRSRWRFRWQLLRRGRFPSQLHSPLTQRLAPLGPGGRAALEALFSGLALTGAAELSVAEAALLWRCASRIEALDWPAFDALLSKRFDQFHGKTETVAGLKYLQRRPDRRFEMTLQDHPATCATWLLLGDRQATSYLPSELAALVPPAPLRQRFAAALSLGQPSALLAPGVILDWPSGLRTALPAGPGDPLCIEAGSRAGADTETLLTRVSAPFPFTELACIGNGRSTQTETKPSGKSYRAPFPGARCPIALAPGLLVCDGQTLLPHLGLPGEAILGTTVANHLLGTQVRAD